MRRILLALAGILAFGAVSAQKYAYVDSDYILQNVPSYKDAQDQLNKFSKQWQEEIQTKINELEAVLKQYQIEKVLLSPDMKAKRETDIADRQKEIDNFKQKRFGTKGDRFRKEEELVKPIQDEVFNAIKEIATTGGYAVIFDAASSHISMLYTDPKYDLSDEVLKKMGHIK